MRRRCRRCGFLFVPWGPVNNGGETERVAAFVGTVCRACFEHYQWEFELLKREAEALRECGVDPRMIDRIMRSKAGGVDGSGGG